MNTTPLTWTFGARVTDIDLRGSLSSAVMEELRQTWSEHRLLLFPDQPLDKHAFIAFAACFGELEERKENVDPDISTLGYVTQRPEPGGKKPAYKSGTVWHSDEDYTTQPSGAQFLLARDIPMVGGDTMFADGVAAYDALSTTLREAVDGLSALHYPEARAISRDGDPRPAVQPLVRVHPQTGKRSLFVGARVRCIAGMSEAESRPLLEFLNSHVTQPEFTYRHRWAVDDLLMWDNRSLLHRALRDYDETTESRHLLRAICRGEPSGHLLEASDISRP